MAVVEVNCVACGSKKVIKHGQTEAGDQRYRCKESGCGKTQKIERKFLTFRTRIKRLARKTICFSKSEWMHDIVIGLFINRFEFERNV